MAVRTILQLDAECERKAVASMIPSEEGGKLYTGVSYWYCQPRALISLVIFLV